MKTLALNEFENNCLAFLNEVEVKGEILILTRDNIPISQITPLKTKKTNKLFGMHHKQLIIHGDIISPIDIEWESQQ